MSQEHAIRESPWFVARRCLALLRRVQQGPARKAALLAAVYAAEGDEAYGLARGDQLSKRFTEDKKRLEEKLRVKIRYDSQAGGYVLEWLRRPLLDLPDDQIRTLAFLTDTFKPESPHADEVQQLVDLLLSWLAEDRQRVYRKARGLLPGVDLRSRDSEEIAPDVWEVVLEAHNARQQLQFDYLSSRHDDQRLRQHIVEPWDFYFSERGHYRLRGFCLFNDGPNGPWYPNAYINYRLSRIVAGSARVLPTKLPPTRTAKPYDVIYELAPAIGRFGVSRRDELIGEPAVTNLDEGWVRVEGRTHDVFRLARNLLYYGDNCRVLGGRELLAEMRKLVAELAQIYP